MDFSFNPLSEYYLIPNSGILHVGAHEGQEIKDYLDKGMRPVLALEPSPKAFSVLTEKFGQLSEVILVEKAAGEFQGGAQLNIASNNGLSNSILRPKTHLRDAPYVNFNGFIEVAVLPLTQLLPMKHDYQFWVLDVQGYELQVLKGAGDRLKSVNFLYIEVNRDEVYEDCAQVTDIDEYLRHYGLHRVLTRWLSSWGDALYVRFDLTKK